MNSFFDPAYGVVQADITTPGGRAKLFEHRINELTKPKAQGGPGLTMDQAIFELRTSEDPKDVELLAAMGDGPSKIRTEKLRIAKHNADLTRLADENAKAHIPSKEVAAAMAAATNARSMAFNVRTTELVNKGLTFNQAIDHMRANQQDAALLAAMGFAELEALTARALAFNVRTTELMADGLTLDQAIYHMRANSVDAALLAAMGA
jgi:hypothetical protein